MTMMRSDKRVGKKLSGGQIFFVDHPLNFSTEQFKLKLELEREKSVETSLLLYEERDEEVGWMVMVYYIGSSPSVLTDIDDHDVMLQ
ncbi:hypothetical protein ABEB36_004827 [Hypothenemus hampei]|uniref:Uncharacterized protein n=1 Tax=Hypothenemus hampei TaxID=57062 RepID=A0ABD1EWG5_HYPHA